MIGKSRNKNKTIFLGKKYPDRNLTSNGQKWFFSSEKCKNGLFGKIDFDHVAKVFRCRKCFWQVSLVPRLILH